MQPISEEFRKEIFYDLTSPNGAGMMLVSHYYFTGRPGDCTDPIVMDPIQQLQWIRKNLPYFSSVAKRIHMTRNALVHNGLVQVIHIQKLLDSLKVLHSKNRGNFLIDYMINLLTGDYENQKKCEMCGSVIKAPPEENHTDLQVVTLTAALSDIRQNPELKEYIKGKRVQILSGKYYGKEGVFRSWCGTMCFIDFPEIGKKKISIEVIISYQR